MTILNEYAEVDVADTPGAAITSFAEQAAPQLDQGAWLREQLGVLTPAELSTFLGVNEQTLALWRVRGIGPDYCRGRGTKAVFYRRQDIETWLAMNVIPMERNAA